LQLAFMGSATSSLPQAATASKASANLIGGDATTGFSRPPRYIHAVLRWTLVLALVACGGKSPEVKGGGGGAGGTTTHAKTGSGSGAGSGSAAAPVVADAPNIGCLQTSCAYHPGAAAYFTCLAGGAGACFHFGGPCAPADACMYDAADHSYKQCSSPVEGQCTKWAAACTPKSACMFDPQDGLHHHCDEVGSGTCKRYGALCAP
jgi:hypothetical protein